MNINRMKPSAVVLVMTAGFNSSLLASPFEPATLTPSQSDFGGVGLMQMPTARMAKEGEFSINGDWTNEYYKYNVSLQLMPWLETTLRYVQVQNVNMSNYPELSGDNKYTDKGIDVKVRLWEEGKYLPETSIGLRDIAGTGLFDGEFIAGTKRFGNLDVTLGIGWGYMGTRGNVENPFCSISDKYCERQGFEGGLNDVGKFEPSSWFTGPASLYGGLEYQTSWQPLRFKLEYDGNDYSEDFAVTKGGGDMTASTPWNIGVLYRLGDWGDARVSYQRGNAVALGVTLRTNFNEMKARWLDEPVPELKAGEQAEDLREVDWLRVAQELEQNAGYKQPKIEASDKRITIIAEQEKYRDRLEAQQRAAAVLANHVPVTVDTYQITETKQHLPLTSSTVNAREYQTLVQTQPLDKSFKDSIKELDTLSSFKEEKEVYDGIKDFDYAFSPTLTQTFGSLENFYLYAIGINADAKYWLTDKWQLSGGIHVNLIDNYDQFNYEVPPDGTDVPRVRTLFRSYVNDNPVRMNRLQLTWFEEYGNGLYSQAYGGYLETMFAGIGGELLYRPLNQNWALGADVNLVSQRDPDSWFGVFTQEYQYSERDQITYRVLPKGTTGFITGYYMPRWKFIENTLLKVGVGQFLAGDIGTRLDFSKQFKSGVIAGAYASFTNMSSEEYGEGSFTKGFYVSIPFDIMTVKPSNSRANIEWQPLTRDGGQMLSRQYNLFNLTDSRSPWLQRPNRVE